MSKPGFPAAVEITEVGLRDGIQNEPVFIPTEDKIRLLDALIDAGIRRFEATSFVSPRAVPQLKDAAEVLAGVRRHPGVILGVLAPNRKGVERALAAEVDEVAVFLSLSESHNQKNLNRSVERSLEDVREAARLVRGTGVRLKGAIATAFGCPFEGDVSLDRMEEVAAWFADCGYDSLTLGDTTGMATPPLVRETVERLRSRVPALKLNLHFHNTRGIGLVNVMEGLSLDITSYESSLAGTGGCPFAPGATGNICTEDTVHLMQQLGVETGIDLDKLTTAARDLERLLGRPLPGQVMRSGPRLRRYGLEEQAAAVG
ncbi:MAG TPA: hydroxymethylglutaryl-CoA lyase [Lautropia sp.]|jgi:hydroxymethylglutaryl-CoA lyase|nr:hydroxymethylglutaryl-CoA lyase [Lautropia sp.]